MDKINHTLILTKTRACVISLIVFNPLLIWVLDKIPIIHDYGLILFGMEVMYYDPIKTLFPGLFTPDRELVIPSLSVRLVALFVYTAIYIFIFYIKDLLMKKYEKHMAKIVVITGIVISAPFVFFDDFIYRGSFCLALALILFVSSLISLYFMALLSIEQFSYEKLFCISLWRVFVISMVVFFTDFLIYRKLYISIQYRKIRKSCACRNKKYRNFQ
jgi:hypothetical protein